MSNGFLYIATGEKYILEAKRSVKSLYEQMPNANVALVTDEDLQSELFDKILKKELKSDFSSSNIPPELSPFDKTVFLDTDTYIYDDIGGLFEILERYDLAASIAPNQNEVPSIPTPFVEYNTGVIAYKRNKRVREFLECWNEEYAILRENKEIKRNQPSFSKAIYQSDVDLHTLPSKYNIRISFPGYLCGQAKIVHGRHPAGIQKVSERINSCSGFRVYYPNAYLFDISPFKVIERGSLRYKIEESVKKDGLFKTLSRGPNYMSRFITSFVGEITE